jgi:hypothetical protein
MNMPPQPNPMMMQQQMRPPMMQGLPPQGAPMMQGQVPPQNIPPEIQEYLIEGNKILPAVVPANPNYKNQVGEFIYEHVERFVGEELAPKVTGMLIDMPQAEIQGYLVDFNRLRFKIDEAMKLLKQ